MDGIEPLHQIRHGKEKSRPGGPGCGQPAEERKERKGNEFDAPGSSLFAPVRVNGIGVMQGGIRAEGKMPSRSGFFLSFFSVHWTLPLCPTFSLSSRWYSFFSATRSPFSAVLLIPRPPRMAIRRELIIGRACHIGSPFIHSYKSYDRKAQVARWQAAWLIASSTPPSRKQARTSRLHRAANRLVVAALLHLGAPRRSDLLPGDLLQQTHPITSSPPPSIPIINRSLVTSLQPRQPACRDTHLRTQQTQLRRSTLTCDNNKRRLKQPRPAPRPPSTAAKQPTQAPPPPLQAATAPLPAPTAPLAPAAGPVAVR